MAYDEITAVSCWLDFALDVGVDLDAEQRGGDGRLCQPRLWKSHQRLAAINPGCKYIVTLRDPERVAASYFHFYESKGLTGGLGIDEWVIRWASNEGVTWSGPLWPYILDYWERRYDSNVLIVCFERLKTDPRREIARIASFIGVATDDALLDRVVAQSSVEFMEAHPEKFDDHWINQLQKARGSFGAFPLAATPKVSLPQRSRLSATVREHLQARWRECITPATGAASYEELCRKICGE